MEATTGFEPVIKVLQTCALPLGYVAVFLVKDSIKSLLNQVNFTSNIQIKSVSNLPGIYDKI